jgi:hypothetical protein
MCLTPGFLRSEVMLERFGVSEATWRDAVKKDPNYICSENTALRRTGGRRPGCRPRPNEEVRPRLQHLGLSDEYAFCDADSRRPHWGRHFVGKYGDHMKPCDDGFYKYWFGGALDAVFPDWPS